MKIGIDITPVIYCGTGVATYTQELVTHLLAIAPRHQFTLFASTFRNQKNLWEFLPTLGRFNNFKVKVFPFPPVLTELAWNRFHKVAIEKLIGPVDIFHAWDWQQPPAVKAKLVTTIHDLTNIKFPQTHHKKTIKVHKRRLRWVKQEADAIIIDSESTKQDVIDLLRVNPQKLHTVYLAAGNSYSQFRNQEQSVRQATIDKVKQKYHLKASYILSVGTREPRKNLNKVILALPLLKKPNLQLVVVGKYGWGKRLKTNVNLLGFVDRQNLPALYAGAQAFVYPSLYEGFGLPVVEAMSMGLPVVTSDRGSLKEVAGGAAVIVDPENVQSIAAGIKTALSNRGSLAKLGLKQAGKFSWEKTAQQTLKVYQQLL